MSVGSNRAEREAVAASVPMTCPIDRYPLLLDRTAGVPASHRRVCDRCGAVVLLPRAPLMRALRRAGKVPK